MRIDNYFMVSEDGDLSDAVGLRYSDSESLNDTATDMGFSDGDIVVLYEVIEAGRFRAVTKTILEEI